MTLHASAEGYGIESGAELKEWLAPPGSTGEVIWDEGYAEGFAERFAERFGKAFDESNGAGSQSDLPENYETMKMLFTIKALMTETGWSLDHTLDSLKMPAEDYERYRRAIELASAETLETVA